MITLLLFALSGKHLRLKRSAALSLTSKQKSLLCGGGIDVELLSSNSIDRAFRLFNVLLKSDLEFPKGVCVN